MKFLNSGSIINIPKLLAVTMRSLVNVFACKKIEYDCLEALYPILL